MSADIFQKLFQNPQNRICADCFSTEITHCSVSHGTLICSKCANLHKSLGPNISYVKSISEIWIPSHLTLLSESGNSLLHQFFKSFSMPSTASIEFKYCTLCAKYYRETLKAKIGFQSVQMARPEASQGITLITDPKAYGNNDLEEEDKRNRGLSTYLNSAYLAGKDLYGKVKEQDGYKKIEDTAGKIKINIKKGAEKGLEYGKNGILWGANKGAEALKTGGEKMYNQIESKTKGIREDAKIMLGEIEKNTVGKIKGKIKHVIEISDDDSPSSPPNY